MVYRRAVRLLFALLMIPSLSSGAASPRAEIETFFERAKSILGEATDDKQARSEFRGLTHTLFDGRAAARQAMGAEWDTRTITERQEFARIFSDVFERAYIEIVEGQLPRHREPSVHVLGEDLNDSRHAVVRTLVRAKDGRDVRMDYAMAPSGERWRVHDVVIDGVSLVENYRGTTVKMELSEKVRLEIGVSDHFVDTAINAIVAGARTGDVGDGKIFVLPVERVVRIRTGEVDRAAVTPIGVAPG